MISCRVFNSLKQNRNALEAYRASLYQKIYRVFQSDPAIKRWNYDLMDVVGWYKAPHGKTRHVQRARKPQRRQQVRRAHKPRRQQQARRAKPQRRVLQKRQPTRARSQAALNATAAQMRQSLAAMVALQRSQALYRQRSAALAFSSSMSQRSTDLMRIQACQLAGNCRYRYEYLPR